MSRPRPEVDANAVREARAERPILFSAPMVRALLDGRKTQTRRAAKGHALDWLDAGMTPECVADPANQLCPYGVPGDRLWVRETYRLGGAWTEKLKPSDCEGAAVMYPATESPVNEWGKLRPSIHMPRWASRLTLQITDVRVERLNDCSEADAQAEGMWFERLANAPLWHTGARDREGEITALSARTAYRRLWEHINGPGSWAANPWVWAVSFEVAHA